MLSKDDVQSCCARKVNGLPGTEMQRTMAMIKLIIRNPVYWDIMKV